MNSVATKRIPVKLIEINRAEGHPGQCYPSVHTSWKDAEERLMRICLDSPNAASKCDFVVTWHDNETYKGRIDALHPSKKGYPGELAAHIRYYLEYACGLNRPHFIPEDDYRKSLEQCEKNVPGYQASALRLLQGYALCDEQGAKPEVQPSPTPVKLEAEPTKSTPKGPTMATTSTQTANPEPMTAKEEHELNTTKNAGKPLIAIPGNTFIIRGLLYRLGGKWDGKAKVWSVPEHASETAKRLAAEQEKPKATPKATPAVTAAPVVTVAKVVQPPKATKATPVQKLAPTAINRRLEALLTGAAHLLVDVKGTSAESVLHSVVQQLEGIVPRK